MDKRKLFQIMNLTKNTDVIGFCKQIEEKYKITVIKKPQKTLIMLKVRESARNSLFYAGEALACECAVKIGDAKGFAAALGDDMKKVYAMAVIDAVLNAELPESAIITDELQKWESGLREERAGESRRVMSTKVNFSVMEE
jgi:alpha-D-ribose 1-methylphosphonate 5-triphosphate synthase subunit PhnG